MILEKWLLNVKVYKFDVVVVVVLVIMKQTMKRMTKGRKWCGNQNVGFLGCMYACIRGWVSVGCK